LEKDRRQRKNYPEGKKTAGFPKFRGKEVGRSPGGKLDEGGRQGDLPVDTGLTRGTIKHKIHQGETTFKRGDPRGKKTRKPESLW